MSNQSFRVGGTATTLGKRLGRGGEGEVFALPGLTQQAVKIYKNELRRSREEKVRAMVDGRLSDSTNLVAFPSAIVTDGSGAFAGFSMRLVTGYRPIHELYSPKSRKIHFPKADYRFLVCAAQNVARAVATVHQTGCVIGDFNHSGVLIAPNATVALIDADSFQFRAHGRAYPCLVGTEDFTPPELHGIDLRHIERTRAHDNFGLAVAIFQLLAMGKHPYAGRYQGSDISLGEAIAQNRFAYSTVRRTLTRTSPPPGSIEIDDLPKEIGRAFEASFGLEPASRPSPSAWVDMLARLRQYLHKCSNSAAHFYPTSASRCMWCRIGEESGVEMFPSTPTVASFVSTVHFDIRTIAASIRATTFPSIEDILPKWSGDPGTHSAAYHGAKDTQRTHLLVGSIALIGAIAAGVIVPPAIVIWIAVGIFGLQRLASGWKTDATPLQKAYSEADRQLRSASLAYLQRTGLSGLLTLRTHLEDQLAQYEQLDAELARELQRLRSTREARQRDEFLDRFLISRAKITGIGPAKTATLAAFGIESARDVSYSAVVALPGFGEALTGNLVYWRQQYEAKFRFSVNPTPAEQRAEQAVRAANVAKRTALIATLRTGLATLQSAPMKIAAATRLRDPTLAQALANLAKIERDCRALGVQLPSRAPLEIPGSRTASAAPTAPSSRSTSSLHPPAAQQSPFGVPATTTQCPKCGAWMVRKLARRGRHAGTWFWSCSRYPSCKGTRN